jgi:hypothetical protein
MVVRFPRARWAVKQHDPARGGLSLGEREGGACVELADDAVPARALPGGMSRTPTYERKRQPTREIGCV